MNDELKYVELEKIEDIIRMTSTSEQSPPLHHKEVEEGHVYFLPASLALGRAVIYFVKIKEKVDKKYILHDMMEDQVSFSDELSTKPTMKNFQVVEVKEQNLLPKEVL